MCFQIKSNNYLHHIRKVRKSQKRLSYHSSVFFPNIIKFYAKVLITPLVRQIFTNRFNLLHLHEPLFYITPSIHHDRYQTSPIPIPYTSKLTSFIITPRNRQPLSYQPNPTSWYISPSSSISNHQSFMT